MTINQLIGYEMAARVAFQWRDYQTITEINTRIAACGMQFVIEDGRLLLKMVGQCEKAVA